MSEQLLFQISGLPVYLDDLVWLIVFLVLFSGIYFGFSRFLLPYISEKKAISRPKQIRGKVLLLSLLFVVFLDISFSLLDISFSLFDRISVSLILEAVILLLLIYIILWIASNVFIHKYFENREKYPAELSDYKNKDAEVSAIKTIRWMLFSLALIILLRYINWDYTFWSFDSPKEGEAGILIRVSSIIITIIIYLIAKLIIWVLTQIILFGYYKRKQFDPGISYSINKLLAYIIYFIATIFALNHLGMNMGLLLGGAAALLVGVGLALQATFTDFFSGLILLFERPIKVGDYVSYEGKAVQVQNIGLRASKVKDRDSVNYFIPNSKLITQTVTNWSHDEKSVRFQINVGVAYGSNTELVEQLLIQAALDHPEIHKRPKPKVIFRDFGNSSLDFELNYYSKNIYNSDWVKSDLRFTIDKLFRENDIKIPFPQRDVWMRN